MFEHVPLTVHEAFSGIAGSISLACWIFLLVPQLIENYRQSSADGISITFLLVWMAGDITNLAGALWADLVPTVIALAIYFCFADAVLLSQCFYYNTLNARRERKRSIAAAENAVTDENAPLLAEQENLGLPGSRRRSSAASRRRTRSSAERSNSLTNILEEGQGSTAWLKNTLSVAIILIAGAAGWAIAWRAGAWKPTPVDVSDGGRHMPVGAEVLGYASAVCYLGYDSHHRHATQACTDMLQVPASLRSSRTTARDHAKDCLYCSFCFRSWAILPTAPESFSTPSRSSTSSRTFPGSLDPSERSSKTPSSSCSSTCMARRHQLSSNKLGPYLDPHVQHIAIDCNQMTLLSYNSRVDLYIYRSAQGVFEHQGPFPTSETGADSPLCLSDTSTFITVMKKSTILSLCSSFPGR